MKMKTEPIDRDFFLSAKSLHSAAKSSEESIVERITYIVTSIVESWDQKLDTWYFDGAAEGEVGDLWSNFNDNEITPLIFIVPKRTSVGTARFHDTQSTSMVIFDKKGAEWDLKHSFPSRWLFQDFAQELVDGKNKWEILDQEKRERLNALSKEKKALVEKAKKKLTKDELNALRGVL
jgi:hypothetical protein